MKAIVFIFLLFPFLYADPIVDRALSLVGKSRSEFVCNQVVNYAIFGVKDNGMLAHSYLTWGSAASSPAADVVVVAKDGSHVGIFVNDQEYIHSSSSKFKVIKVGIEQLKWTFPSGYVLRKQ